MYVCRPWLIVSVRRRASPRILHADRNRRRIAATLKPFTVAAGLDRGARLVGSGGARAGRRVQRREAVVAGRASRP